MPGVKLAISLDLVYYGAAASAVTGCILRLLSKFETILGYITFL